MIRLTDATVLAYTKLKVHKIRTGVAIAIAGLLFGLMAAMIIVIQGVFSSVDHFADEGLNNKTVLSITRSGGAMGFNEYDKAEDPAFVSEIEVAHKALIEKKKAAALKYGVMYMPEVEDPSPIGVSPDTKQKVVKDTGLGSVVVQDIANQKRKAEHKPFDIESYLQAYSSAKIIQDQRPIQPSSGLLAYMKDGKEKLKSDGRFSQYDDQAPSLTVLDKSLSDPFVSSTDFDPQKGEIPVIIPYGAAEKLLGFEKLGGEVPMQEKYTRLQEVRNRVGEITASYCYRNNASQGMVAKALAQQEEMKTGASIQGYVKPTVIYELPSETTCGAVTTASDTRTAAEKAYDAQYELYEKEIGTYIGEPIQQLITVRGVGISSDVDSSGQWSIAEMTKSLFASNLGYGSWSIPADLLAQVPEASCIDAVFGEEANAPSWDTVFYSYEAYLVDFSDKAEARKLLSDTGMLIGGTMNSEVYAMPFGSGTLFVDELKNLFTTVLIWVFAVVGIVAVIILASVIGRTVSEGRHESSIFRAIGASRVDISSVYGMYVLLLASRIVAFTAFMGIAIALVVELLFWQDATLGDRLAYAASDTTKEFHLFSLMSPYLLWIVGVIFVASIIASIIPILLGARRNPIKDMRNE